MRHFLQSSLWADFHESLGTKVLRHQSINGSFTAFYERSHGKVGKLLSRLYLPYGPFVENTKQLKALLAEVESFAKEQKADYIRIEPVGFAIEPSTLIDLGYVLRPRPSQPAQTNIVSLDGKSAEEIIAGMNATNRNLWRANNGKGSDGVKFSISYDYRDTAPLIEMMEQTSKRLGLTFHDAHYTEQMVRVLGPKKACGVVYALKDNLELAGAQFGVDTEAKTLYYLHAGSHLEAREHNAGNLLLTYLILQAHELGIHFVDLFGVAPKDAGKDHPQAGFSSFKRSFGGDDVEFNGTWEKGLSKLKYKLMTKIRN